MAATKIRKAKYSGQKRWQNATLELTQESINILQDLERNLGPRAETSHRSMYYGIKWMLRLARELQALNSEIFS
jgi:hypothetical protein